MTHFTPHDFGGGHQNDDYWNTSELLDKDCLCPCLFQTVYSILDRTLYTRATQRSLDYVCGVPFNSYSLWAENKLFSHVSGLQQGEIRHNIVNAHIYEPVFGR